MDNSGLFIFFVFLIRAMFAIADNEEFYCVRETGKWQVCRRCRTLFDENCEKSQAEAGCKCDNVKLFYEDNNGMFKSKGGVEDCQENKWCYVLGAEEGSNCADDPDYEIDYDEIDNLENFPNLFLINKEVAKSSQACEGIHDKTGNEDVLENIEIATDNLQILNTNGSFLENLKFFMESADECQEECQARTGNGGCGAWSYNKQEGVCFLHNVDSCCGQFGKRINNSQFISGYHCTVCWSTKQGTECPCDVEDRTQEPGSAHSTGASKPLHLTPTAELSVHETETNADLCACQYRKMGRPKECKCAKQQCKHEYFNPNGTCEDPRRCRKSRRVFNPDKIIPC